MLFKKLLALSLLAVTATAQANNQCLHFDDALKLAAQTDPAVLTARAQQAEAEANVTEAKSLFKPQISAFGRSGLGDVGVVDSAIQNQLGLRVSQRLFDFGDAKYARRIANFNLEATADDIRQAQMLAAQESGLLFLSLMEVDEQLEITKQRYDFFKRQLNAVDDLLQQGGATRSERADVAAELAETEAFILELQFQREQAETRLTISTGVDSASCKTVDLNNYFRTQMAGLTSSEQAISKAIDENPALAALEKRADALGAESKRERLNHLPVIDVVGLSSYTSGEDNSSSFELQNRVGLDISVPIFSGNSLRARKRQAAARENAARSEALDARRQLRESVSIIYRRINSLDRQLSSRENVEEQKLEQFSAAEAEYSAGVRALPDLIDIRIDYEQSSLDRIRIQYDLLQQRLQLLIFTSLFSLDFNENV